MTFQQLIYAVEIAHYGSINQAAQHLYVSQSCLSDAIKNLEKTLGIHIFARSNRGITITKEGKEFLQHAKALIERMQWMKDYYQTSTSQTYFQVSSLHYGFVNEAFIDILKVKDVKYDRMGLRNVTIHQVIEDVYLQHSQIGILFISEHTQKLMDHLLQQYGLNFHPLIKVAPRIFLNKQHPLAHKSCLHPDDLIPYPYLYFELPKEVSLNFCEELQNYQLPLPQQIYTVNDYSAALRILANSNAYTSGSGLLESGYVNDQLMSIAYPCGEHLQLGYITHGSCVFTPLLQQFITSLHHHVLKSLDSLQNHA